MFAAAFSSGVIRMRADDPCGDRAPAVKNKSHRLNCAVIERARRAAAARAAASAIDESGLR
jgi:hypothetical protein